MPAPIPSYKIAELEVAVTQDGLSVPAAAMRVGMSESAARRIVQRNGWPQHRNPSPSLGGPPGLAPDAEPIGITIDEDIGQAHFEDGDARLVQAVLREAYARRLFGRAA